MIELSIPIRAPAFDHNQDEVNKNMMGICTKGKLVDKINDHFLYMEETPLRLNFALLDSTKTNIVFFYVTNKKTFGHLTVYEEVLNWKNKVSYPSKITSIFIDYIIPKTKRLLCSNKHTDLGIHFWKNLINKSHDLGYYSYLVKVTNTSLELVQSPVDLSESHFREYWSEDKEDIRLLISRKKV